MKKSILMAMFASVLLTGCLVKKSDYEAEQASHAASKQELLKLTEELANSSAQLKTKTKALKQAEGELSAMRAELEKSRTALIAAQQQADALRAESAISAQRAAELASRLEVAEQQVAEAKAVFMQRFQELKTTAEAELSEVKARNEQLRKFMHKNFPRAAFHAEGALNDTPAEKPASVVVVKKAP